MASTVVTTVNDFSGAISIADFTGVVFVADFVTSFYVYDYTTVAVSPLIQIGVIIEKIF